MKILIVDDEALARIGIRTIIPWEQHGFQVAGEASNGLEALKLAKVHKPDIILVDILMPEMNGLDFISEVHKHLPLSKFIILSCMTDVEYYKKAIRLGVSEYIQKNSIDPGEILEAVTRVSREIQKERVFESDADAEGAYNNQHIILTEFFNMVIKGKIKEAEKIDRKLKQFDIPMSSGGVCVFVISTGPFREEYDEASHYQVINLCQEIIKDTGGGYIFKNYEEKITAVVSCPLNSDENGFIKSLCSRMWETVNQCLDISLTIGASGIIDGLEGIYPAYRQSLEAISYSFFLGEGKNYYYNECRIEDKTSVNAVENEKNIMMDLYSLFDTENFIQCLRNFTRKLSSARGISPHKAREHYTDILFHIIELMHKERISANSIFGDDFDVMNYIGAPLYVWELSKSLENLLNSIKSFYKERILDKRPHVVSTIRKYISQHINEKLSLEEISEKIHFSPAYISRLYKRETGENLQDYIMRIKVEKSKEFLGSQKSLPEISELLGFSSVSYFIKVFKAYTGTTPGQYLKKFKD